MSLLDKCKEFEELMNKYSKYGATDPEPLFQFRNTLRCKIYKDTERIPNNADDWELYSVIEGAEFVAEELTQAFTPIIKSIDESSQKEVKEVVRWYGIEE